MILEDGRTACDRDGRVLPGYGALFGLITTDLDEDQNVRQMIFCYESCRDVVLAGLVTTSGVTDPPTCSMCGVQLLAWATSEAMLCTDLDPADPEQSRMLALCYVNGHRDQLLTQVRS